MFEHFLIDVVFVDPEIEVKVMSTDTTSGNTGFTAFSSRLFFLFTDDTYMIHCSNPRDFGLTWGVLHKTPLFQP